MVSEIISFGAVLLTTKATITHEVLDLPFAYQMRTTEKKKKQHPCLIIRKPVHLVKDKMTARQPFKEGKGERKIWMHSTAGVQIQLPKLAHALVFSILLRL